jgi:hypothetical protein
MAMVMLAVPQMGIHFNRKFIVLWFRAQGGHGLGT